MPNQPSNIIIYNTADGKTSVALYAKEGRIWLNQQQMVELGSAAWLCKELFGTSKQTVSHHIINIRKEKELLGTAVGKKYLSTCTC